MAHYLLDSPHTNSNNIIYQNIFKCFGQSNLMGVELVFRAKISSHGKGKYIIYIPKEFSEKAKELYEDDKEVIIIVAREG
ncbi:hypothetical protein B9Q04_20395 [Candidatus Marsarchaeota G2 archaeon BE_D]|uniref:Uncharacterized protein n=1 Tax=Candidatus Marsarchaeota G2 archaeon BE_D TaxID=1978158 RepID=A0A2R6BU79_9ARCH|nr:MAG: hypothetical protein B9Q04_20395 [Candidatus Marsarchaeota G2 archaeon BE_D]